MNNNFADNRGMAARDGNIMRIENAIVEEVSVSNGNTGYILVSYQGERNTTELLRLNVSRNTAIFNASGRPTCLCDIEPGMRIDARISTAMTRSIPPQSNAFVIAVRSRVSVPIVPQPQPTPQPVRMTTTDRVIRVDVRNQQLLTGSPRNINSQMRFIITDDTVITGRNGRTIPLRMIRPGDRVRITHANFQTASIPPQTTAFQIQVL